MIIAAHMIGYSSAWIDELSVNKIVGVFLSSWSILAVDVFVVIPSYYMTWSGDDIGPKYRKRMRKSITIILETIGASFIARCFFSRSVGIDQLISALRSPFNGEYWYITAYISLIMLSPLLDIVLDKKYLRRVILAFLIILDFIPAHCNAGCYRNDVLQFCMIYLLVGSIKQHDGLWSKFNGITLAIGMGAAQLFYWVMFCTKGLNGMVDLPYHELTRRYSIVMVYCAISVFSVMLARPIKRHLCMNRLAESTLAVYIWHAGPSWQGLIAERLKIADLYETVYWPIALIFVLIGEYLVFALIWVFFNWVLQDIYAKCKNLIDICSEKNGRRARFAIKMVAFYISIILGIASLIRVLSGEDRKTFLAVSVFMVSMIFYMTLKGLSDSRSKLLKLGGGIHVYDSWISLSFAICFLLFGRMSDSLYLGIISLSILATIVSYIKTGWELKTEKGVLSNIKDTIPIMLFFVITVVVCVPGELYLNNLYEFALSPRDYFQTLLLCAVCFLAIYVLGMSLFLDDEQIKLFNRVVFALIFCGHIQRLFLNGHMGQMDGISTARVSYLRSILNAVIWIVLFAMILLAESIFHKSLEKLYRTLSIYISLIEVVTVLIYAALISEDLVAVQKRYDTACEKFTWDGFGGLSSDKNVVVFVLDWFDGQFMEQILREDEDFLDPLEDFTYYVNTTSMYAFTGMSIPYLLSGVEWEYDMSDNEYCQYAFKESNMLDDIADQGFDIRVYTDPKHIGDDIKKRIDNIEIMDPKVNVLGVLDIMTKCSKYQMAPFVCKQYFYYTTDDLGQMVFDSSDIYYLPNDDKKVMEMLTEDGLYVGVEDTGAFRFYHLCGAHMEYKKDMVPMAKYSMQIVYEYIDQLKRLGVYDETTIIITADHGQNCLYDPSKQTDMLELDLEPTSNPILFVKEENVKNSEGMTYSMAPVSHKEVVSEVMHVIDPTSQEYGETLSDISEEVERERIFIFNRKDLPYVKAAINGNVRKPDSWVIVESIPLEQKK